jgi:hypothetical protein
VRCEQQKDETTTEFDFYFSVLLTQHEMAKLTNLSIAGEQCECIGVRENNKSEKQYASFNLRNLFF